MEINMLAAAGAVAFAFAIHGVSLDRFTSNIDTLPV